LTVDLSGKKRERMGTDGPPPLPQDLESAIQRTVPLDEFLGAQESVKSGCDRIENLKGEIELLHKNALMTVDEGEAVRIGKKIEAASLLAATESSNVRRLLKVLDEETRTQNNFDLSESDLRLRQSKQRALCKRFMKLMEEFELMQRECKAKYQKQMERQYLLVKPDATEQELASLRSSPQAMSQQVTHIASE
jgi:t-SNARE complex subunit (syntaxin)